MESNFEKIKEAAISLFGQKNIEYCEKRGGAFGGFIIQLADGVEVSFEDLECLKNLTDFNNCKTKALSVEYHDFDGCWGETIESQYYIQIW